MVNPAHHHLLRQHGEILKSIEIPSTRSENEFVLRHLLIRFAAGPYHSISSTRNTRLREPPICYVYCIDKMWSAGGGGVGANLVPAIVSEGQYA